MKVVTTTELMALPAGTFFHEWKPCYFGDMCIKGDTILHGDVPRDWWEQVVPWVGGCDREDDGLFGLDNGLDVPVDLDCEGRDGIFDDARRFAVWSLDDMRVLRDRITKAIESIEGAR